MKKILISTGTFSTILAPIATVISCSSSSNQSTTKDGADQDNSGGTDTVNLEKYDFSWSSKNPDSTNRPTSISELKKAIPNYYDSLSNTATGDALFKELQSIQETHRTRVGSYSALWNHYRDSFRGDWFIGKSGSVMDLYGEVPTSHGGSLTTGDRPYQYPANQDKGTGGSGEGHFYNREHLIPQSYFRASKSERNIKNDPHFTWPADKSVNSSRSNYHFAEVNSVTKTYEQNSIPSSKGYDFNGGVAGTDPLSGTKAVEPVDWFKGDIARSHFHFLVTWTSDSNFEGNSGTNFKVFKPKSSLSFPYFSKDEYASMYLKWNSKDPVDKFNTDLNQSLASNLTLRNPFIDMPNLANLIWS